MQRGSSSTARSTTTHAARRSRKRGHSYASRTDSETILHLYEERGLDFIHDIEGDYAIAIWDARAQQLVLVRDRIGVKPLYIYHRDVASSSHPRSKRFFSIPLSRPTSMKNRCYDYLSFLTTPAPSDLFRDIQKPPGRSLIVLKRDGTIKMQCYWDALPSPASAGA
jgi:asparagine synthase (glutamine-hydrolysing)